MVTRSRFFTFTPPKSCGLFTSDAYYIFDIIDGKPLDIHRIKINDSNHEKISALDKKYKAEIYKGTRDSAYWADRFTNELSGHLSPGNEVGVGKVGAEPGNLDSGQAGRNRGVPGASGDLAAGEGKNLSINPDAHYLRDTSGRTLGWFDPKAKEVHLLPGADPKTVAHEIMWHGTRDYISQLAAKGDAKAQKFLDMMRDVETCGDRPRECLVKRGFARCRRPSPSGLASLTLQTAEGDPLF